MSALGLNDHHEATTVGYLRFARYQRGQRLKAVDLSFKELKESRLIEDTFTIDEVTEMLDGLLTVVRAEVETELINSSHTNVLLLRQLFQQAEQWHLKLQADISELENRELLEHIKLFEERQFSGVKGDKEAKLLPMNEGGGAALLKIEIERLREENGRLKAQLSSAEGVADSASSDRRSVEQQLSQLKRELDRKQAQGRSQESDEEVDDLRRQMRELQSSLSQSSAAATRQTGELQGELVGTKHELLKIREMLELAEKELEKKVSQTAPFKNLKQMLQKKNEQIKDLRRRLARYEALDD